MVETSGILVDAFDRVQQGVDRVLAASSPEMLAYRPDPEANHIAWLIWHLTRIMDDHVMEIADQPQVWVADGWNERFDLPFIDTATGFGHTTEEVGRMQATDDLLRGYHSATQAAVGEYLVGVTSEELDRVIDEGWDPPVTVGVRLVSVIGDTHQHLGQAAYVAGLYRRL